LYEDLFGTFWGCCRIFGFGESGSDTSRVGFDAAGDGLPIRHRNGIATAFE
jgi:hypothetical protein